MGLETIALIAAGAAVVGAGASVYQGEQQASAQRKGLRRQDAAQAAAKQAALSQQIRAEQAQAAANKKAPDLSALLAFEQNSVPSVKPAGIDRSRQKLGRPSLLGDA